MQASSPAHWLGSYQLQQAAGSVEPCAASSGSEPSTAGGASRTGRRWRENAAPATAARATATVAAACGQPPTGCAEEAGGCYSTPMLCSMSCTTASGSKRENNAPQRRTRSRSSSATACVGRGQQAVPSFAPRPLQALDTAGQPGERPAGADNVAAGGEVTAAGDRLAAGGRVEVGQCAGMAVTPSGPLLAQADR